MNSSTDSSSSSGENSGGFAYGAGVSFAVLLLIVIVTLTSYFCTKIPDPAMGRAPARAPRRDSSVIDQHSVCIELGLDEPTIRSYPKLLYSQAKSQSGRNDGSLVSCCSICLGDYKDTDTLRLLPDCGHAFHQKCVDPWLRLHPTCPLCRNSPVPTPLSTPLAEVAPLSTGGY